MGIHDRDYWREPAAPDAFGRLRMLSVTGWLILVNVAVFLFNNVLIIDPRPMLDPVTGEPVMQMGLLERWGHFSYATAIASGQVWRFITFQFLHSGAWHLMGNMLGLYFFGSMVESYLGRRRFLAFYLLCGITGPIAYLLLQWTGTLDYRPWTPLIGASAGVFGILMAGAAIAPRQIVQLLFPPIPIQLRTFAYVLLAVAVFTVFTRGQNAGGEAAHLGGAALGYYLIRHPWRLDWAEKLGPRSKPNLRIRH